MPPKKSSSSSRSEPMPGSTSGTDGTETPVTGDGGSPGTTAGTSTGTGGAGTTGATAGTSTGTSAGGTTKTRTPVITHIIYLCGFSEDSTMVAYMDQEQWTDLAHVTSLLVDDIKDFHTVKRDGTYEASPLKTHCRMFKCFLLYYKWRCDDMSTILDEDDVLGLFTRTLFLEYCGSADCYRDIQVAEGLTPAAPRGVKPTPGIAESLSSLTVQEFRRGVKRDKSHYDDLKDDKYFSSWNRGFAATARMHHTHLVLDETYAPNSEEEYAVFREMQVFMYAVFEEHLKTGKGKSLVSQYEEHHDAQSIYRELKKHALSSTAAQLSGDTLLQYITTTRYPVM